MSEYMSNRLPGHMSDRMPEYMPDRIFCPNICPNIHVEMSWWG